MFYKIKNTNSHPISFAHEMNYLLGKVIYVEEGSVETVSGAQCFFINRETLKVQDHERDITWTINMAWLEPADTYVEFFNAL